jgi:hypothetical protein
VAPARASDTRAKSWVTRISMNSISEGLVTTAAVH